MVLSRPAPTETSINGTGQDFKSFKIFTWFFGKIIDLFRMPDIFLPSVHFLINRLDMWQAP